MQFEFQPTQEDIIRAIRHGAGISFPLFRSTLPWHSRPIGPFTPFDLIGIPIVVGFVALFLPWHRSPFFAAIYLAVAGAFLIAFGLIVNRRFGPPRTPAAYMKAAERLARRALKAGTLKVPTVREGVRLEAGDLITLGALGTSLVPVASIDAIHLTSQDVYLITENRIVSGLPRRAFPSESALRSFVDAMKRPVLNFP